MVPYLGDTLVSTELKLWKENVGKLEETDKCLPISTTLKMSEGTEKITKLEMFQIQKQGGTRVTNNPLHTAQLHISMEA